MLRRSSSVALLLAAGCFAEPGLDSTATSGGSSSSQDATGETQSAGTMLDPSSSTGSDSDAASSSTGDCPVGQIGCRCNEGVCDGGAECIEGFCEVTSPVGCGDNIQGDSEECDDGNTDPGDGCSPLCTLERECFFAHLGGPGKDSIVRTYSVFSDGTMSAFADTNVPGHNPPPTGPGSELNHAVVSCLGQVYVASSTSDAITRLRPTPKEITLVEEVEVLGVRELACDPDRSLLFATRSVENGFAVNTYNVGGGSPVLDRSEEYTGSPIGDVRLTLDRDAPRALLNFVETVAPTPYFAEVSYGPGMLTIGESETVSVIRSRISDLVYVPSAEELLGIGEGPSAGPVVYRIGVDEEKLGNTLTQPAAPWNSRRNIWPLRLPSGEAGFAMGGAQGVVMSGYSANGEVEVRGATIADSLSNTFARTAFNSTMLVVASPDGFEIYDISQLEGDTWPILSTLEAPATEAFTSGTVIPCP